VRRRCETVGDLDVLIETDRPDAALAALAGSSWLDPVQVDARVGGPARLSLGLREGPRLDVMTMPPGAAGSYLVHFTGSAAHNVALRHRARRMGWSLSEHGLEALTGEGGPLRTFATEGELYAAL
jgi:DNA polymerase (family 10)